jgi:crotonobetainyl-CoA:carnitine CoA-transferase CaiB-like acyl-CoA transferase
VTPGSTSLADYMSGLFGAVGVLIALRHAERTGEGQVVDVALYESIFRVLDELAPAYARSGFQRERMGPDTVNAVPHGHFPTRDGAWVALACSNDRMWRRLTEAMGRPELGDDPRYASPTAREDHRDELNALVSAWTGGLDLADVLAACERVEAPVSKLLSIADIFADPQYAARGNLLRIDDPRAGELIVPAPAPRLSLTPSQVRSAGPALGDANADILGGMLGLSPDQLAGLKVRGVI